MTLILLPDEGKERRLVFYLAMEEYVAGNIDVLLKGKPSKEAFFLWQASPTVIFGRNQVMEAEVNVRYCREHGISLYRRKSGGGCVYSDRGNIMHSFVTGSTDVGKVFDWYLDKFSAALRGCGIDARRSGRNDILVGGKKVSGNAFFRMPNSSVLHGTLLYDTDLDVMEHAISPSSAKISSKGVSSVRQHVANLKPLMEYFPEADGIDGLKKYLSESFCMFGHGMDTIMLSHEQVSDIEMIEAEYLNPDFIYGRNHKFSKCRKMRINDVGDISVEVDMDGQSIVGCRMTGDFLFLKNGLNDRLSASLAGVLCDAGHVSGALRDIDIGEYVTGLDKDVIVSLITE